MKEAVNLEETYKFYEDRYNIPALIKECNIDEYYFNKLTPRSKLLLLSKRLLETKRVHLASFFLGKLFEITGDIEALITKIDCLIDLGEYEDAFRFNCIGFELYLESPAVDILLVEEKLFFQKGLISFYTSKYHVAEWVCEEGIIKYQSSSFYYLLCAVFIISDDLQNAKKFFEKYSKKISDNLDFLIETLIFLFNVNSLQKGLDFVNQVYRITEEQNEAIIAQINNYYTFNKDKVILKEFFKKEAIGIV